MKYFIKEDKKYKETEIEIRCHSYNKEIDNLVNYIKKNQDYIIGKKEDMNYSIVFDDIYYIESVDNKTFVYTCDDCYEVNYPLYKLEELLMSYKCIRISKSMILNIHYLKSVKALFNGKYEAILINDEKLIISRRYVSSFKKEFGL